MGRAHVQPLSVGTRCFLATLGALLLAWGLGLPLVAALGARTTGTVVEVRRQLGDRGEALPNRYGYTIHYQFRTPDGRVVDGHTSRVGDYFSPREVTQGRSVQVRYWPRYPVISVVQWHWAAALEHGIVACVGGVLWYLATRRRAPTPPRKRRGRA